MQLAQIIMYLLPDGATIEWKGEDQWALKDDHLVWNHKKNRWVYEPIPSSRSDKHIFETRFDSDELAYATWEKMNALIDWENTEGKGVRRVRRT